MGNMLHFPYCLEYFMGKGGKHGRGQWGGSVGIDPSQQAQIPKFDPWYLYGERKELNPSSCPLTFSHVCTTGNTYTHTQACMHTHTQMQTHSHAEKVRNTWSNAYD